MNDKDGDSEPAVSATIVSVPPPPSTKSTTRAEQQMRKLRDANVKYKDLLKLAKGRIQTQEEELENLKSKVAILVVL